MRQEKGIVIECKEHSHLLVITKSGEILRLPYQPVPRGREITFQVPNQTGFTTKKAVSWVSVIMAACIAVFLLTSPVTAPNTHAAPTYVSLELKKSYVEMQVSSGDRRVLDVQGDESGQNILQRMNDWKEEKLDVFLLNYLQTAKKSNLLQKKDKVIVAEKSVSPKKESKSIKQIQQKIEKSTDLQVYVLLMPPKVYQEAKEEGMPPARYVILKVARNQNIPIPFTNEKEVNLEPVLETEPVQQLLAKPPESEAEWMALLDGPSEQTLATETKTDPAAKEKEEETSSSPPESTSASSSSKEKEASNNKHRKESNPSTDSSKKEKESPAPPKEDSEPTPPPSKPKEDPPPDEEEPGIPIIKPEPANPSPPDEEDPGTAPEEPDELDKPKDGDQESPKEEECREETDLPLPSEPEPDPEELLPMIQSLPCWLTKL